MPLDLVGFVRKWEASQLTERSAAPQHFRDLCEVLGVPHPTQVDEIGASYTFEKRVTKAGTGEAGSADVWKRGWFAWEYKSKGGDLNRAYKQLNEYHEALDNPPLLIVCDFVRFEVHTKFENLPTRVYKFVLTDLLHARDTATCALPPLEVLRHVFGDFNQLRPTVAAARVTEAAAADFLHLAQRLELERAASPDRPSKEEIAHFLMRLVFCLFADSVRLLPNHAFRALVTNDRHSPFNFNRKLPTLFHAMSFEHGFFGADTIPHFNGGLFSDNRTIDLDGADMGILYSASQHDWSHIEPAIFGTLFERSLDQAKRSMIGAHYTSSEDILLLIEPVVIAPLKSRWQAVQQAVLEALAEEAATEPGAPSSPAATPAKHRPSPPENRSVIPSEVEGPASLPRPPRPAKASATQRPTAANVQKTLRLNRPALTLLQDWAAELSQLRILDPACGSGNFLYVALRRLLDLWHEARVFGVAHGLTLSLDPMPNPAQLFGIEIDFYAHEIASIVVWIGFLQWKVEHGIHDEKQPLLKVLDNIEHNDAILRYDPAGKLFEPTWPQTDFIIGNPPFLGGKLLRRELGDKYVDHLFDVYRGRVKAESDLVVYWFEKARQQLEDEKVTRIGLLATQGIRGGANRAVLDRISETGTIFWAWSDRPWLLKGATVHVSMIGFERQAPTARHITAQSKALDPGKHDLTGLKVRHTPIAAEPGAPSSPTVSPSAKVGSPTDLALPATTPAVPSMTASSSWVGLSQAPDPLDPQHLSCTLNGRPVLFINADLTSGSDTASAHRLRENRGICFMGTTKVGPFDIDAETARKMLSAPLNPNGRPNSDVVRPWVNALDITRRPRDMFIIDFGTDMPEQEAALYELPFEYVRHHVQPIRAMPNRDLADSPWWIHGRPRGDLRHAVAPLSRYILTSRVSKYRLFIWLPVTTIPDSATFAFARDDGYFFGVLHSRPHELWALQMGTQLESRPRYTPDSTFDTFPFPWPPGTEPTEAESLTVHAIADAARDLVRLRDAWLNPPGIPEADLKDKTLTKLYNQRPTWLSNAHRTLDRAVFAAYGWPSDLTREDILARLLALNHQRAAATPDPKRTVPKRSKAGSQTLRNPQSSSKPAPDQATQPKPT